MEADYEIAVYAQVISRLIVVVWIRQVGKCHVNQSVLELIRRLHDRTSIPTCTVFTCRPTVFTV